MKLPAVCIALAFAAGVALGMFSLLRNCSVLLFLFEFFLYLCLAYSTLRFFRRMTTRRNLLRCTRATELPFWRKPATNFPR